MNKWTIKNYNVFLRETRSKFGISQAQAREVYKQMSAHLGRKLYGRDVGRHPRITQRYAKATGVGGSIRSASGSGKRGGDTGIVRLGGVPRGGSKAVAGKGAATVSSLAQFYDYYDGDLDYDYDEVESSADYKETPA